MFVIFWFCFQKNVRKKYFRVARIAHHTICIGWPKKQNPQVFEKNFNFNYSSFLFQVVVVDLVHEILQQQFSHHVLVNRREGILRLFH